ncbi:MAG: helix-turn-helix domain-containing protein [Halosimplex sp.]
MADSIGDLLRKDMECEGLLECLHGLKDLDRRCFEVLVESDEPLTVDEVAERVDRERSTAYRAVQRLLRVGLIGKEQVNYDDGGYYHVYHAADADEIADEMQRILNDWYAQMGQLIGEFREKYDSKAQPQPAE